MRFEGKAVFITGGAEYIAKGAAEILYHHTGLEGIVHDKSFFYPDRECKRR